MLKWILNKHIQERAATKERKSLHDPTRNKITSQRERERDQYRSHNPGWVLKEQQMCHFMTNNICVN